jgi:hypothetical protein
MLMCSDDVRIFIVCGTKKNYRFILIRYDIFVNWNWLLFFILARCRDSEWRHCICQTLEYTLMSTPLWGHPFEHTCMSTPLWGHPYEHTFICTYLWAHLYEHTLMSTPLWTHPYEHTFMSTPLWALLYEYHSVVLINESVYMFSLEYLQFIAAI